MTIIKGADFERQIKKKHAAGYLFFGEEDYLKAHSARILRQLICGEGEMAGFNHIRLCADEYSPEKLKKLLLPLPMFGERKLIELAGLDFCSMKSEELGALCNVLAALREYDYNTILIYVAAGGIEEGKLPSRPSPTLVKLGKYLDLVKFEKCPPAKLVSWAGRHFLHNGVGASPEICRKIINYCGRNMYILAGEIDKVSFYALSKGRNEVQESDIHEVAVPDSDYDAFAFANALMAGDRPRALSVLMLMKQQRIEPVKIMAEVSSVFCDLLIVRALSDEGLGAVDIARELNIHEYRAKLYCTAVAGTTTDKISRMLGLCAEADAALKLSPTGYAPIELLVCSL
ncbi:MAG: DNA polymerase III subunit delta [Clostridiales bacterium]|nr:DNA polymerase III subunit delta [Clostridiales bacterium]